MNRFFNNFANFTKQAFNLGLAPLKSMQNFVLMTDFGIVSQNGHNVVNNQKSMTIVEDTIQQQQSEKPHGEIIVTFK